MQPRPVVEIRLYRPPRMNHASVSRGDPFIAMEEALSSAEVEAENERAAGPEKRWTTLNGGFWIRRRLRMAFLPEQHACR